MAEHQTLKAEVDRLTAAGWRASTPASTPGIQYAWIRWTHPDLPNKSFSRKQALRRLAKGQC